MKLRIEARPGEIRARLADLIRTVEALAKRDGACLCKSDPEAEADRDLLIPAMREAVERADSRVERIRQKLEAELVSIVVEV